MLQQEQRTQVWCACYWILLIRCRFGKVVPPSYRPNQMAKAVGFGLRVSLKLPRMRLNIGVWGEEEAQPKVPVSSGQTSELME